MDTNICKKIYGKMNDKYLNKKLLGDYQLNSIQYKNLENFILLKQLKEN